jgi:hypothetical protein
MQRAVCFHVEDISGGENPSRLSYLSAKTCQLRRLVDTVEDVPAPTLEYGQSQPNLCFTLSPMVYLVTYSLTITRHYRIMAHQLCMLQ